MIYLGVFSVIMVFGLLESYLIKARKQLKANSEATSDATIVVSDGK